MWLLNIPLDNRSESKNERSHIIPHYKSPPAWNKLQFLFSLHVLCQPPCFRKKWLGASYICFVQNVRKMGTIRLIASQLHKWPHLLIWHYGMREMTVPLGLRCFHIIIHTLWEYTIRNVMLKIFSICKCKLSSRISFIPANVIVNVQPHCYGHFCSPAAEV